MTSEDPLFKGLWKKVQGQEVEETFYPNNDFNKVLQNQDLVLTTDVSWMHLQVNLVYSTEAGESPLHVGREGIYPSGLGIPMRKNAPYASALNKW